MELTFPLRQRQRTRLSACRAHSSKSLKLCTTRLKASVQVIDLAVMDLAVMDLAVMDPAVMDPAVTDPAVMDPAVMDPAVTDPVIQVLIMAADITVAKSTEREGTSFYMRRVNTQHRYRALIGAVFFVLFVG